MSTDLEQTFSALTSREKMKFLRWAAESVGAKLDTVFGAPAEVAPGWLDETLGRAEETAKTIPSYVEAEVPEQMEIPEFLKR